MDAPTDPPLRLTFRKQERLRRPSDFERVYTQRRSLSDASLIVYGAPNTLGHLRLGLSVSKKFGGAVVRNRIRRLFREAFRLSKRDHPPGGMDVIIIPRRAELPTLAELQAGLVKLMHGLARRIAKESAKP